MATRLVHLKINDAEIDRVRYVLRDHCARFWQSELEMGKEQFSALIDSNDVDKLLVALKEEFDEEFDDTAKFDIIVMDVRAVYPEVTSQEVEDLKPVYDRPRNAIERFFSRDRISTDELFKDVNEAVNLTPYYLITVVLSAVIAALGMQGGQTAVVIGAMVIAPLLGPTMALALSATLANTKLAATALIVLVTGFFAAFIVTFGLGMIVNVNPDMPELISRTKIQPGDIALALASGAAGVLAFSRGSSLSLIGVMIAVALVPPVAASGMFLGAGYYDLSVLAFVLFMTNLVCINIAGIVVFLMQGLIPRRWRITWSVLALWLIGLCAIGGLVAFINSPVYQTL